ncbi:MAG: AmmeMemoRadiSam system radical SAM enzyme [Candidatus Firestonebacteria bacterium]
MKEALYYEKLEDKKVYCSLCPKECKILEGKTGFCQVRLNKDGDLYSTIYEEVTSLGVDPVEKKPLYHFYPGSYILSVGTNGCNLGCDFCQNWEISQVSNSGREKITSDQLLEMAEKENSIGIAYTYNEPFIWFEFVLETAIKIKNKGLKNVLVTNGFVNEKPLLEILPYIDAMNIDLKSFNGDFYKKICKGDLEKVKRTIEISAKKCHIELTNLIVPTLNDSKEEITNLVDWIAGLSPDIPLHFSKYSPRYKMDIPETPVNTLNGAYEIAKKKLKYVYLGNIYSIEGNITYCPDCKKDIIVRRGYNIAKCEINNGKCRFCNTDIRGVF